MVKWKIIYLISQEPCAEWRMIRWLYWDLWRLLSWGARFMATPHILLKGYKQITSSIQNGMSRLIHSLHFETMNILIILTPQGNPKVDSLTTTWYWECIASFSSAIAASLCSSLMTSSWLTLLTLTSSFICSAARNHITSCQNQVKP